MATVIYEFGESGVSEIPFSTDANNYFNQPGKGHRIMFDENGWSQGYLRVGDIIVNRVTGALGCIRPNGEGVDGSQYIFAPDGPP